MLIISFAKINLWLIGDINVTYYKKKFLWIYLIILLILIYILNDFTNINFRISQRILNTIKDFKKIEEHNIDKNEKFLRVKNAEGEPDTIAKIIIQNKIDYIPKVSVIIPVYNSAEYLAQCLDTIIEQTLKDIEIICIDDGSTDNSFDILKTYSEKDERITIIKQRNMHSGVAKNAGLAVAKGNYLSFLDSEDFFELNMLEIMYKRIIKKQSDIIICKYKFIDLDTEQFNKKIFTNNLRLDLIDKKNNISALQISKIIFQFCEGWTWDKLFRTEFILSNDIKFQNLSNYNDNQFTYTALCFSKSITVSKKRLVIKRQAHKNLLSTYKDKDSLDFLLAFNKIKYNLEKSGLYHIFKDSLWKWIIELSITRLIILNKDSKIIVFNILRQNFLLSNYINLYSPSSSRYRALYYLKEHNYYPTISIVYVINNKHFNSFLISLVSILKNSEFENLNFIILYDDITLFDLQKINELKDIRAFGLQTINISNSSFKYLPTNKDFLIHILIYNLYRLYNIDKIIYLHSKTIVRKSLIPLLEINMDNKLVAGVEDISFSKDKSKQLTLKDKLYINDGVLLFNLKEWRTLKIYNITKFYIKNNNKILPIDKDFLNILTDTKKHLLNPEFNYIETLDRKINCQYDDDYLWLYKTKQTSIINYSKVKIKINSFNNSLIEEYLKYSNILKNIIEKQIIIPIVLSADNSYAPFMYITMISILEHGYKNTYYIFYLLVPSNFSKNYENMILELNNKYKCNIHFVYIQNVFEKIKMKIPHISFTTFYRLLIGNLLPKEIDKCIYLDVDIIVNNDLSILFNINLKKNYIAGVISPTYYFREEINCKRLNVTSMKKYINAGVLLINLKQIRVDNMTHKFIELAKKNFTSQDQDVLNVACYGKILTIPPKFNAMTKRLKDNNPHLRDLFKEKDIIEANKSPVIVHYSDKKKPWNSIGVYMEKYWWNIAKKTSFINNIFNREILYKNELEKFYCKKKNKKLALERPRTFNEKIQWLKLYDSTPIKTRLIDKYLVRGWIMETIGEEYLIPLLGVYDNFDDIQFEKLPNKFVIKCNHGAKYTIIVPNKKNLNLTKIKSKIDGWLNTNYAYVNGLELQYRDIQPKILVEKYIEDDASMLKNYKFICFNGRPFFISLDYYNRSEHKRNLYDLNWNQLPYKINSNYSTFQSPERPKYLKKMVELAFILSKNFSYVSIGLYATKEKIYFGGMTFTSSGGIDDIKPKNFERRLSLLLKIPKIAYNIDTEKYYKIVKTFSLYPYYIIIFFSLMKFIINIVKII